MTDPHSVLAHAHGRYHHLAEHIYELPDPCDTYEAYLRYTHQDLLGYSESQLLWEEHRWRQRLAIEHDRKLDPWLVERGQAIRQAKEALRARDRRR